uniref:Leucine-rich repeat-containing protein 49 n=1 Tax=Cyprinus carpio TaxID=7962 RepID=A0A8C1ITF1_CYPCA
MCTRGLTDVPHLDAAENLRLLNMQHNLISHLQDLLHLRRLVFLDLYDNRVIDMSGVSSLTSLRVLLLGKNRIQRICDVDGLTKLDVLDLHSNQISQIENVSRLSKLRLLNLSGNRITRVENLQGLNCLTELNLRHNSITSVTDVENLPRLQRLFLSSNSISRFDALACLWHCRSLSELSVDGNPVALESCYRQTLLRCCSPHLQLLDMKRVTEEERRTASVSARKEDEKKKESHKQAAHKERRRLAIQNAAQQWEGLKACLELPAQNGSKEDVSPDYSPAHSPAQTNGNTQETSPDDITHLPQLAALAQVRRLEQISVDPEGNPVVRLTLWRSFLIYRLQHLNLQKINGTEVTMNEIMASERMFGALGHVAATETPRCRLLLLLEESRKRQLQFLLDGRGRRSGQSPDDLKENGKQLGDALSRALFTPHILMLIDQRPASLTPLSLSVCVASAHCVKADALQKLWPSLFSEIVRDCVLEMRDRQAFRQTRLQRLHSESQT